MRSERILNQRKSSLFKNLNLNKIYTLSRLLELLFGVVPYYLNQFFIILF